MRQDREEKQGFKLKLLASFAVIYFVWGSTYLGIRLAIDTIPPFTMAGARFVSTPAKVGTYAYFNPLVAMVLGAALVDEAVTPLMLVGAGCILVSLLLINQPKFLKRKPSLFIRPASDTERPGLEPEPTVCPDIPGCCNALITQTEERSSHVQER